MSCKFCDRPPVAKGLCNAHYLRHQQGREMSVPIHVRRGPCLICGKPNYGLGACRRHYHKVRAWMIKTWLVNELGGRCIKCKQLLPVAALDFHHRDPTTKIFALGNAFNTRGKDELLAEARKCELLCANCHRIHHTKEETAWQLLNWQFPPF